MTGWIPDKFERLRQLAARGDEQAKQALLLEARRHGDWATAVHCVLEGSPSADAWRVLTQSFEAWPESPARQRAHAAATQALEHWPTHLRQAPLGLHPVTRAPDHPAWSLSRHLDLSALGHPDTLIALSQHPQTVPFEQVDLSHNNLTPRHLQALLDSPLLTHAHHLNLAHNRLDHDGVRALARHRLPHLQTLNLSHNPLQNAGGQALPRAPWLDHLQVLTLAHTQLSDPGVAPLVSRAQLALTHLDLSHNHLQGEGLRDLLHREPPLASLHHLNLAHNQLDPMCARLLAASPLPPQLEQLALAYNQLGPQGAQHLAHAPWVQDIRQLDLTGNLISDDGAHALAHAPWQALHSLHLGDNMISERGVTALAHASSFAGLHVLTLQRNRLWDRGLAHLLEATWLEGLTTLNVADNFLTLKGLKPLTRRLEGLPLTHLDLSGNRLGPALATWLQHAALRLRLHTLGLARTKLAQSGFDTLLSGPPWPRLRVLDVADNHLHAAILRQFATSNTCPALESLTLDHNPVDNDALIALIVAPQRHALHTLSASHTEISGPLASTLAALPQLARMQRLNLSETVLGVQDIDTLRASPYLQPGTLEVSWLRRDHTQYPPRRSLPWSRWITRRITS